MKSFPPRKDSSVDKHKARKRFGQNFLNDSIIIEQILSAIAPSSKDKMVEIGPGLGAITKPLVSSVNKLIAVELDKDLIKKLNAKFKDDSNFKLHNADILKFNLNELVDDNIKLRVVGNIPYNISTPLIFHLLSFSSDIIDIHLMVQKEVAIRLTSTHGNKNYGRLSVMSQFCSQIELLFDIGPESFTPAPAVQSSFIRITPNLSKAATVSDVNMLQKITTTAFNQRRKTISNSLKSLVTTEDLEAIGIKPTLRPEQIPVEDYIKLSNALVYNQNK